MVGTRAPTTASRASRRPPPPATPAACCWTSAWAIGSGLDLLEELTNDDSPLAIVLISGYGDVSSTVRAMRSGAVDVLTKPPDVARLQEAVTRADALSRQQFARKQETGHLRELL